MTPPPPSNPSKPTMSTNPSPPPLPPLPEDAPSMPMVFGSRAMPLPDPPSFADLLDLLDLLMSNDAPVPPSKAKWNGRKAAALHGEAILNFLLDSSIVSSRSHAARVALHLVRSGGLIPTFRVESSSAVFNSMPSATYIHRGLSCVADYGLNAALVFPRAPRALLPVLRDLTDAFKAVCHVAVSLDGHFVDYPVIQSSQGWRRALVLLAELAQADEADFATVPDVEKKAVFFNLYNLLIFHAKLVFGHPNDLVRRGRFFNSAAYLVAGKRITSVELEHGVLRATMPDSDPRSFARVDKRDARMHFILNCGAQSCPPLRVVNPERVEETLRDATEKFIAGNVEVDLAARRVTLSRLWKWFRPDFTPGSTDDDELLKWIALRAPKEKANLLTRLMAGEYKIKFDVYNWADNGDTTAKPDIRFMSIYDLSFARSV